MPLSKGANSPDCRLDEFPSAIETSGVSLARLFAEEFWRCLSKFAVSLAANESILHNISRALEVGDRFEVVVVRVGVVCIATIHSKVFKSALDLCYGCQMSFDSSS